MREIRQDKGGEARCEGVGQEEETRCVWKGRRRERGGDVFMLEEQVMLR